MARKAICFYKAMVSNSEIQTTDCKVVSSRTLDYNTIIDFKDKKIAVIDDVVVKGSSLKKIISKLKSCDISANYFVAACERDFAISLSNENIALDRSFSFFEETRIYDFAGLITKYIEASMCPFNIDQPVFDVFENAKELTNKLNELNSVDITSGLQRKYGISSQVLYFNYNHNLDDDIVSLALKSSIIKIRFMFGLNKAIAIPFVLLPELTAEQLDRIFLLICNDRVLELTYDENERLKRENRLKLISYIFSELVLSSFFSLNKLAYNKIKSNDVIQFNCDVDSIFNLNYLFTSPLFEGFCKIKTVNSDCNRFMFTNYIAAFYNASSKMNNQTIQKYEDAQGNIIGKTEDNGDVLSNVVFSTSDFCSQIFLEYDEERIYYVSSVIDVMIDRGVIVPSIVHRGSSVVRAYKMGEYSKLTREQVKSFAEMLRLYQKKVDRNLNKTEFEKLCVLFFHGAINSSPPIFKEQTSFENDCYGIGYSLYGPRISTTETAYTVDSDSAIITDFLHDDIVRRTFDSEKKRKLYYIPNRLDIKDRKLSLYCAAFSSEMYAIERVFNENKIIIKNDRVISNPWNRYVHTHIQYLTLAAIGSNLKNQFLSLCAELYMITKLNDSIFSESLPTSEIKYFSRLLSGINSGLWKYVCFISKYLEKTELKLSQRSELVSQAILRRPDEVDVNPVFDDLLKKTGSILFRIAFFLNAVILAKQNPSRFEILNNEIDGEIENRPQKISDFGSYFNDAFQDERVAIEKNVINQFQLLELDKWASCELSKYQAEARSVLDLCDLFLKNNDNPNHTISKDVLVLYSKEKDVPETISGLNSICFKGISESNKCSVYYIPNKRIEDNFFAKVLDETFHIPSIKYIVLNMSEDYEGIVQVSNQAKGSFIKKFLEDIIKELNNEPSSATKELILVNKQSLDSIERGNIVLYRMVKYVSNEIACGYYKTKYNIFKEEKNMNNSGDTKNNYFYAPVGAVDSRIHGDAIGAIGEFDLNAFNNIIAQIIAIANKQSDVEKAEIIKQMDELKAEINKKSPNKDKAYKIIDWTEKITSIAGFGITLSQLIAPLFGVSSIF